MSELQNVADLSRKYGIRYRKDAYKKRGAVAVKLKSIQEKILKRTNLAIEIPKELYSKRKVGNEIGNIDIVAKKSKLDQSVIIGDQNRLDVHNSSMKIGKQYPRHEEERKVANENLHLEKENTEQSYQGERLIKRERVSEAEYVNNSSRSGNRFSESNKDDVGRNTNVSSPNQPLSIVNSRSLLSDSQYAIQYRNDGYKKRGAVGEKFKSIQEKVSKRRNLVIEIPKEMYAKRKVINQIGDIDRVSENSTLDKSVVIADEKNTGQNSPNLHNSSIRSSKQFPGHGEERKVVDQNLPSEKENADHSFHNELLIKQESVSDAEDAECVNESSQSQNNKNNVCMNTDVPSPNQSFNIVNSRSLHDDSQHFNAPNHLDGETAFSPKGGGFEDADDSLPGTGNEEILLNLQNTTALAIQFLQQMKSIKSMSQPEIRISDLISSPKTIPLGRLKKHGPKFSSSLSVSRSSQLRKIHPFTVVDFVAQNLSQWKCNMQTPSI